MNDVQSIRILIQDRIRKNSAQELSSLSREIIERFKTFKFFSKKIFRALRIGMYRSLPSELKLDSLAVEFEKLGAHLYYPKILDPKNCVMDFYEVHLNQTQWKKGLLGVEEPVHAKSISPSELDIVFVPGIAFGKSGERIGRGSGYYDRYLKSIPEALKVALVFDFQLFERLPQESWDVSMDWIISEKSDIQTPRFSTWLKMKGSTV